ncbi:MAG: hypothetical protein Q4B95_10360 [Lonepinella koalarum]|nr:hypothetical protein [Lonepinella koalarum]
MTKKCYRYIISLLCSCILVLASILYFFTCEIGFVDIVDEFGSGYDFFEKKKDMHRIFYIEPTGERDLNQLHDEQFNELVEFCMAAKEGTQRYKISCNYDFWDELKRRKLSLP